VPTSNNVLIIIGRKSPAKVPDIFILMDLKRDMWNRSIFGLINCSVPRKDNDYIRKNTGYGCNEKVEYASEF
jgi:hypothetical protein